jgi:hypothetical protein
MVMTDTLWQSMVMDTIRKICRQYDICEAARDRLVALARNRGDMNLRQIVSEYDIGEDAAAKLRRC